MDEGRQVKGQNKKIARETNKKKKEPQKQKSTGKKGDGTSQP